MADASLEGTAELPTAEDTIALGARLGADLRAGDVVVLSGPLGAGKTVLAKGIAAGHGRRRAGHLADVRAGPGAPGRDGRARPPWCTSTSTGCSTTPGADLLAELDSLDLDTDLDDAVVVVEWGEGLAERLSDRHLDIRLERGARHRRADRDLAVEPGHDVTSSWPSTPPPPPSPRGWSAATRRASRCSASGSPSTPARTPSS